MPLPQPDLFDPAADMPAGFRYRPEGISGEEQHRLVDAFAELPFREFEFHGYLGKRRVVSFGWRYDYGQRDVQPAAEMPDFLLGLRDVAADFAGIAAVEFRQAMVTEYMPGAGIGWHRDKPVFGEVVALSLLSPCTLRFRRRAGAGWERRAIIPQPRSFYLLQGPARTEWEHSTPGVEALRYSVTFRRYIESG